MANNVKIQVYRGPLADLQSLATTGAPGVMAWTTDSYEMYVDLGSGNPGIGPGNAWQRLSAGNQVWTSATFANLNTLTNAQVGDLAVASDNTNTYLLTAYPASNSANWVKIATGPASDVTSVNGITPVSGNVTLSLDNIPDGFQYAREYAAAQTKGEFDLAKSHALGHILDNMANGGQGVTAAWAASTPYILGACIKDSNGNIQQAVVAGTSGTPTAPVWATQKAHGNKQWAGNTAFLLNDTIVDNNGNVQKVTTAGTTNNLGTGGIYPGDSGGPTAFSATQGGTTTDGTVTWTCEQTHTTDNTVVWENIGANVMTAVQYLSGATANEWVTYIDATGTQHLAQPMFSNIGGTLSQTQLPASIGAGSNLTSIDCGTF